MVLLTNFLRTMEIDEAVDHFRKKFAKFGVDVETEEEYKFLESLIRLEYQSVWDKFGEEHYDFFKKLRLCKTHDELVTTLEEEDSVILKISGLFQIMNYNQGLADLGFGQRGMAILEKLFKFVDDLDDD